MRHRGRPHNLAIFETPHSAAITCGSRVAAVDCDVPEIGINVPALDDAGGADLTPVNASFRRNAVHWMPPVPDTQRYPIG